MKTNEEREVISLRAQVKELMRQNEELRLRLDEAERVAHERRIEIGRLTKTSNDPVVSWAIQKSSMGRQLVALIPPTEVHDGPRYAGYYCEDGPRPQDHE